MKVSHSDKTPIGTLEIEEGHIIVTGDKHLKQAVDFLLSGPQRVTYVEDDKIQHVKLPLNDPQQCLNILEKYFTLNYNFVVET